MSFLFQKKTFIFITNFKFISLNILYKPKENFFMFYIFLNHQKYIRQFKDFYQILIINPI